VKGDLMKALEAFLWLGLYIGVVAIIVLLSRRKK
jgi:hypothetical protein